ncbi:hypothetical protein O3P69_013396 [Scylla paramamosain]|uniref:Uncharacterized protein n=1 Tax=Scylla paramamosain TaxID=85552 RepID=A0AAW0U206_SCYPA
MLRFPLLFLLLTIIIIVTRTSAPPLHSTSHRQSTNSRAEDEQTLSWRQGEPARAERAPCGAGSWPRLARSALVVRRGTQHHPEPALSLASLPPPPQLSRHTSATDPCSSRAGTRPPAQPLASLLGKSCDDVLRLDWRTVALLTVVGEGWPAPQTGMGDEKSSLSGSAEGSYGSYRRTSPSIKPFTQESLERLETRTSSVIRDYGFLPRRTPIVVDGGRLPTKYEPFPRYMYGRPLEEIDRFIFEEQAVEGSDGLRDGCLWNTMSTFGIVP